MLGTIINWERSGWRAALQKGIWGCWLTAAQYGSAACRGSQEGKQHPGVHQTQRNQPAGEMIIPLRSALLWSHLQHCAVLGPTIEGGGEGP